MLTDRFSRLFGRLLSRWVKYQDAPRDPARVTELAAARIELDEVRSEIAGERELLLVHAAPVRSDAPRVAVSDEGLRRLRVAGIGLDTNG
ncbi:MAG: hypothetical protein QNJ77_05635 [Acidimicrobiia bacterium]|nr:hypothetical protein [Acidimicrobiia bacterium]